MRISTHQMSHQATRAITDRQAEVSRTQQQLGAGERILNPSDAPADAARVLEIDRQLEATAQYQRNIDFGTGRLGTAEGILGKAGDLLQRARELTVQANNDHLTDLDRGSIAQEVRELRANLLDLANTRDGEGEYLFAGHRTRNRPFTVTGDGSVAYGGDQGQRLLQVGADRRVAVTESGAEVFMRVPDGKHALLATAAEANTGGGDVQVETADAEALTGHSYELRFADPAATFDVVDLDTGVTVLAAQAFAEDEAVTVEGMRFTVSGTPAAGDVFGLRPVAHQDLFTGLDRLVTALETPVESDEARSALHASLDDALVDLGQGVGHLADARGRLGSRLRALEQQAQANTEFTLRLQSTRADLMDLDYAEAAVRLSQESLALQAAQQSFARVQGLSLFDYLR